MRIMVRCSAFTLDTMTLWSPGGNSAFIVIKYSRWLLMTQMSAMNRVKEKQEQNKEPERKK